MMEGEEIALIRWEIETDNGENEDLEEESDASYNSDDDPDFDSIYDYEALTGGGGGGGGVYDDDDSLANDDDSRTVSTSSTWCWLEAADSNDGGLKDEDLRRGKESNDATTVNDVDNMEHSNPPLALPSALPTPERQQQQRQQQQPQHPLLLELNGRGRSEGQIVAALMTVPSKTRQIEIQDTYMSEPIIVALLHLLQQQRNQQQSHPHHRHDHCKHRIFESVTIRNCAMECCSASFALCHALVKEILLLHVLSSHPNLEDICNNYATPATTMRMGPSTSNTLPLCLEHFELDSDNIDNSVVAQNEPSFGHRADGSNRMTALRWECSMMRERDVISFLGNPTGIAGDGLAMTVGAGILMNRLTKVSFQGCYFETQAAKRQLVAGLGDARQLQVLNLSGCRLEDSLVVELIHLLLLNESSSSSASGGTATTTPKTISPLAKSLRHLNIGCNQCISMDSVHAITRLVRSSCSSNSCLETLNLRQMWKYRVERGIDVLPLMKALGEGISKKKDSIYLPASSSLQKIILAKNELGDDEMTHLAASIIISSTCSVATSASLKSTRPLLPPKANAMNQNLVELLDIRGNAGITLLGANALLSAMRDGVWFLKRLRISPKMAKRNALLFFSHFHWAMPPHATSSTEEAAWSPRQSQPLQRQPTAPLGLWPKILARVTQTCDPRYHDPRNVPTVLYHILRRPNERNCSALPLIVSFAMYSAHS
jgi:hypothetical protein